MMASNSTYVTLFQCMSSVYGVHYKTLSRNHNVPWLHYPPHGSTASRTSPRSFKETLPSCCLLKTLLFYAVNELNRGHCSGVRNVFLRSGVGATTKMVCPGFHPHHRKHSFTRMRTRARAHTHSVILSLSKTLKFQFSGKL